MKVTHHLVNTLQARLLAKTLPAYWRYVCDTQEIMERKIPADFSNLQVKQ